MRSLHKIFAVGTTLAAFAFLTTAASAFGVGDPAPALSVGKWSKGTAVKGFEKGQVYVVEFWATWCGPCKESIPHLTEMAKKFKGKVSFIGVSVFETENPADTSYYKKVDDFVKTMGKKMEYNVAIDDKKGSMAKNWMEAANQDGIPTAFIVGKDGKIAWIGHPMAGLEDTLDKVVKGTYNSKSAADEAKKQADREKMLAEATGLQEAMEAGDNKAVVKEIDKLIAKDPGVEEMLGMQKYFALVMSGGDSNGYAMKLAEGVYAKDANNLNSLAWYMIDGTSGLKLGDPAVSVKIAEKAVGMTKADSPSLYMYLDTLAYGYYKTGKVELAIKTQEKAVALMNKQTDVDPATKKEITDRLAEFKSKKG